MSRDIQCTPHPNTVTKMDGGDYGTYVESGLGRRPLPFALAEKIDNAIAATKDNPPELKKLIEVFFLFDDQNVLKNICIRDNGSGMDPEGLRAYATYHYSQEARERDASAQKQAFVEPPSARNSDPQALDGRIGHFGVGGQHSVFFMGFMEHIMTKTPREKQVCDMIISGDEMHKRWEENKRDEVYSFKVNNRAAGDCSFLDARKETHPVLRTLIAKEKEKDQSSQFSLFVISQIKEQHVEAMKDFERLEDEQDQVEKVTEELARVYHYYLHGKDGNVEPSNSSDSDDEDDFDSDGSDDEDAGTLRRRRRPQAQTQARKKQAKGAAAMDDNISVKIMVHAYKGATLRFTSNLYEVDNVEATMHRRARGTAFSIGLRPSGGAQVMVCLYYFPVLFGKETRPLDEYEDVQEDEPILSCYWQGRWIPYALVKKLKFLEVAKGDDAISRLQGRLRGTVWFPRSMLPSNNKLFLQKSPEVMLGDANLRIYQPPNWREENHKGVRAQFRKWLQDCSAQYDMNLEFKNVIKYDRAKDQTHFNSLRFGHAEYKAADKVKLRKGFLIFAMIDSFICNGEHKENAVGAAGLFAYRRYPLELFGGTLFIESVDKLSSKLCSNEDQDGLFKEWKDGVELMQNRMPKEIAVVIHSRNDEADSRLRPKKMSFSGGSGAGSDSFPTRLREEAGYQLPALDVYVVSEEGKSVNKVASTTKFVPLAVQLKIKKLTDVGWEGKQRRVDQVVVDGNSHLQKKANATNAFEFPELGDCFQGAGDYELTFHIPGFHRKVLQDEGPNEGKWMPADPITWTTKVTITAAPPAYFNIKWHLQNPLVLGNRTKAAAAICLRDRFKDKTNKKSQGNLCFLDGQLPSDEIELLCHVTEPQKMTVALSFSEKRGESSEGKGWFDLDVRCTPAEDHRFSVLCEPGGRLVDVKGTVSLKMKKEGGGREVLNALEGSEKAEFKVGPGKPKQLVRAGKADKSPVEVENHTELPRITVRALDQWGHIVVKDKSGTPLKIKEVLECQQLSKAIRARKERQKTWATYDALIDAGKGYASLGRRSLHLEQPRVTSMEQHCLVYWIASSHEDEASSRDSGNRDPSLEVQVNVLPSALPHDVRVFRDGKVVEDGQVQGPAGSQVSDIRFQFYDEAGNEVAVTKDSGWVVRGGGWDRSRDVVVADPIIMPPVQMRTKTGDTMISTVMFTGPALDSHHPPKETVDLSFTPHPAAPKRWLFADPAGRTASAEVLQLSVGQKLREVFCLQLQDEFQNVVDAKDCEGCRPKLLMVTATDQQAPVKCGDWDAFDLVGSRFLPAKDASLEGATGTLQFMVSHDSSVKVAAKVENSKQSVQVVCGEPKRLKVSLVGMPHGDDIEDIAHSARQVWRSCCVIDRVIVQLVDQWGNHVDRLKEKMEVQLEVEGGTLQAEFEKSRHGEEALRGMVKKESGDRVWKKVKIRMGQDARSGKLTARCLSGATGAASISIDFKPCNKVTRLELEHGAYQDEGHTWYSGDRPKPLEVTVHTEDGQPYEGRAEGIKAQCSHEGNTNIEIFTEAMDRSNNTFTLQPTDTCFEKTGRYTIMVWYEETRPALLETLMKCDRQLPATKQEFAVKAGKPFRMEMIACEMAQGSTRAVCNAAEQPARSIAQMVRLKLLDEHGNSVVLPENKCKVGASIQPIKRTFEQTTREIFCDLEFVFCNDAKRAQEISHVRSELNRLELEKTKAQKDQEEKNRKVLNLEQKYQTSNARVQQMRRELEMRAPELRPLSTYEEIETHILALRDSMQTSPQRRRPKFPRGTRELVDMARNKYGPEEVLGTLLDLCYVENDDSCRIISWRCATDLKTVIFRTSRCASDFLNLPAARRVYNHPPRVLGLDVAAKWTGHRDARQQILPQYKGDQAYLNERMAVNMLRFYAPENEYLREQALWPLVGQFLIQPNRQEALEYMAACRQNRRSCPEMISMDDGMRIQSTGVMGGGGSCAPSDMRSMEAYYGSEDRSCGTKAKMEALKELQKALTEANNLLTHSKNFQEVADQANQTAKRKAWELEQHQKDLADKHSNKLRERDLRRNTSNTPHTPYSPGQQDSNNPPTLANCDATMGLDTPIRYVWFDKDGRAKAFHGLRETDSSRTAEMRDLELVEGSGLEEDAYIVRFQAFSEQNRPVHRQREADVAEPYERKISEQQNPPPAATPRQADNPPSTPRTHPPAASTPQTLPARPPLRNQPAAVPSPRTQQSLAIPRVPRRGDYENGGTPRR